MNDLIKFLDFEEIKYTDLFIDELFKSVFSLDYGNVDNISFSVRNESVYLKTEMLNFDIRFHQNINSLLIVDKSERSVSVQILLRDDYDKNTFWIKYRLLTEYVFDEDFADLNIDRKIEDELERLFVENLTLPNAAYDDIINSGILSKYNSSVSDKQLYKILTYKIFDYFYSHGLINSIVLRRSAKTHRVNLLLNDNENIQIDYGYKVMKCVNEISFVPSHYEIAVERYKNRISIN